MNGVLTPRGINEVLKNQYIGFLGCSDESKPYVVPVTFYFDEAKNQIISYTSEGKKVSVLRKNPQVCLSVAEINDISHWKSVMVEGIYEELDGMEALKAIELIVKNLRNLVRTSEKIDVEEIKDISKANPEKRKVIYRIQITGKSGRYEEGESVL